MRGRARDLRESFGGLAPRLVQKGVQAVVAMQYPITNMAAIDFSRVFYEALLRGAPLDHAVQLGRQALMHMRQHAARTFGTPVLYLHSADGLIQPADQGAARPLEPPNRSPLSADDLLMAARPRLERIADEGRRLAVRRFTLEVVERLESLAPRLWLAELRREWRHQFSLEGAAEQQDVLEAMMSLLKERGA